MQRARALALLAAVTGVVLGSLTVAGQTKLAEKPQLVMIDTDIGDDIDDAFALGLALQSPELKVLAVTTTFGDTGLRARLIERYLKATGHGDIPVGAGPATQADNLFTQKAYALREPAYKFHGGTELMLETIREHPGEVTLIAIGPLFTVQAAIARDPATFRKLKRVLLMGGSVERGYDGQKGERRPPEPEWNLARNPAGAQALLAAGVPVYILPLDSTQIHLDEAKRERIFADGSAVTDQIALLYHQWRALSEWHSVTPTLFDPVPVAFALRPELCPMKPMRLEIDARGMTLPVSDAPNAQVCLQADEAGFMKILLDRLAPVNP